MTSDHDEFLGAIIGGKHIKKGLKDFGDRRKVRAESKAETKKIDAQTRLEEVKGAAASDLAAAEALQSSSAASAASDKKVYYIIGGISLLLVTIVIAVVMLKKKK